MSHPPRGLRCVCFKKLVCLCSYMSMEQDTKESKEGGGSIIMMKVDGISLLFTY